MLFQTPQTTAVLELKQSWWSIELKFDLKLESKSLMELLWCDSIEQIRCLYRLMITYLYLPLIDADILSSAISSANCTLSHYEWQPSKKSEGQMLLYEREKEHGTLAAVHQIRNAQWAGLHPKGCGEGTPIEAVRKHPKTVHASIWDSSAQNNASLITLWQPGTHLKFLEHFCEVAN